jgi:hypothetical protein
MLRIKIGHFFDSEGVNRSRTAMIRRRMASKGATMRITAKK